MPGAEPRVGHPGSRRHRRLLASALAALLLMGGGAAVAAGVRGQQPDPPTPRAAGELGEPRPAQPSTATGTASSTPSAGSRGAALRPVRVRIPAIKVNSRITVVGQHKDGTLEVPQPGPDYDKAAWFRGSPAPGQLGPAVIEGHVDGAINGPSVFYRLGTLKPGDTITVRRRDRSTVRFTVYAVRLYKKDAFPRLAVYGNTAGPELRLITCGGAFDPHRPAGGYTSNIVVFARAV